MKLSSAVEKYLDDVCAGKDNETPSAYRAKLRRMIQFLGDRELTAIRPDDLQAFKNHLLNRRQKQRGHQIVNEKLSTWTIRSLLKTARQFWAWCARNDLIRVDPASRLILPKEPEIEPKAINQATVDKLLDTAAQVGERWERARNIALLSVLRDTGGRTGGLITATLDDLDIKAGTLTTHEKGGHVRDLSLNEPACEALVQWLEERDSREPETNHIFVGVQGHPLTRNGVYRILSRLREAGHIHGRMNPHAFRHAFARDSLRNGANVGEVSQMMGHSSPNTTLKYYARWNRGELKEVHRRVSPGAKLKLIKLEPIE